MGSCACSCWMMIVDSGRWLAQQLATVGAEWATWIINQQHYWTMTTKIMPPLCLTIVVSGYGISMLWPYVLLPSYYHLNHAVVWSRLGIWWAIALQRCHRRWLCGNAGLQVAEVSFTGQTSHRSASATSLHVYWCCWDCMFSCRRRGIFQWFADLP